MIHDHVTSEQRKLPCVVQLGFAGSRRLFDHPPTDTKTLKEWENDVEQHLRRSIEEVRSKLTLEDEAFFCGISQIAIGADMAFARVLTALDEPHRIFLPQPVSDFLSAIGSNGTADFSEQDHVAAIELLAAENVIQQKTVSNSTNRQERFRETNAAILQASDFVICVIRANAERGAGGSNEFVTRAKAIGKPVLEIQIEVADGKPKFENRWSLECDPLLLAPRLPPDLDELRLPEETSRIPSCEDLTTSLSQMTSFQSQRQRKHFVYLSFWIIAFHLLATLLATAALTMGGNQSVSQRNEDKVPATPIRDDTQTNPGETPPVSTQEPESKTGDSNDRTNKSRSFWTFLVPLLLVAELFALSVGRLLHMILHNSKSVRHWANSRVVAELARSVKTIDPYYMSLNYLFQIQLPESFRHLLRTLNVLHLRTSNLERGFSWQESREKYIKNRVDHQISFLEKKLDSERPQLNRYESMFKSCTWIAIIATFAKLGLLIASLGWQIEFAVWPQILGLLAIVMPALAIAALSWSSGLDYQARIETFDETLKCLKNQRAVIETATTKNEYDQLVVDTETILLGETANWFVRRANTNV